MNDGKFYFYKMPVTIFGDEQIKVIRMMDHGNDIILLYFWMIARAASRFGYLRLSDKIAYTPETLAGASDFSREVCSLALNVLQQFGYINILDDGTIYIVDIENFVGSETIWAKYKKNSRKKNGANVGQNGDNVGTMSDKCPVKLDNVQKLSKTSPKNVQDKSKTSPLDIDIDTDIEIDSDKERDADRVPARPTLKEIEEYITVNNKHVDPRTFFSYYEAHGWKGTHGADIGPRWRNFVDLWEARDQAESKRGNLSRVTDPDGFHRDVHGIAYMTKSDYDMQRDDAITLLTEDI